MKKFVAVLLAAVLCLSFAACGGDKATDKTVDAAAHVPGAADRCDLHR